MNLDTAAMVFVRSEITSVEGNANDIEPSCILRCMQVISRWTPYMDDCVGILRKEKEAELDFVLAHQAKCHELSNQVTNHADEIGHRQRAL